MNYIKNIKGDKMNVQKEIENFSKEDDKQILLTLLSKYHFESEWKFVAKSYFKKYGEYSYQVNRIWYPTEEGKIIYQYLLKGK